VRAAILPGMFKDVSIARHKIINEGEEVAVEVKPSVVALDGERRSPCCRKMMCGSGCSWTVPRSQYRESPRGAAMKGFFMISN